MSDFDTMGPMSNERKEWWKNRMSPWYAIKEDPNLDHESKQQANEELWTITYDIVREYQYNSRQNSAPDQMGQPQPQRRQQQNGMEGHRPQVPQHPANDSTQPRQTHSFSEPVRALVQQFEVVGSPEVDSSASRDAVTQLRLRLAYLLEQHERSWRSIQHTKIIVQQRQHSANPLSRQDHVRIQETMARNQADRSSAVRNIEVFIKEQAAWRRATDLPPTPPHILQILKAYLHIVPSPVNGGRPPETSNNGEVPAVRTDVTKEGDVNGDGTINNGLRPVSGQGASPSNSPTIRPATTVEQLTSPDVKSNPDHPPESYSNQPQVQQHHQTPSTSIDIPHAHSLHNLDNQPALTLKQGLERADSFRQTTFNDGPVDARLYEKTQLVFKDNSEATPRTSYLNPPENFQPPAHTPVAMPPPRPTLTGGISGGPQGMMGQPAVQKLPGYVLEGGPNDTVLAPAKLQELVREVTGGLMELDEATEQVSLPLLQSPYSGDVALSHNGLTIANPCIQAVLSYVDQFVEDLIADSCDLAKVSGAQALDVKHIAITLERQHNIRLPGYSADELRTTRKTQPGPGWYQKIQAIQTAKVTNATLAAKGENGRRAVVLNGVGNGEP